MTSTVSGGTAPYNWTAANLPAGLSISSTMGVISGALGLGLTVKDSNPNTATFMFTWIVQ